METLHKKEDSEDIAVILHGLTKRLKGNFSMIHAEMGELKSAHKAMSAEKSSDQVSVSQKALDKLSRETTMVKSMVTRTLQQDTVQSVYEQLISLESELLQKSLQLRELSNERDHWRARCEASLQAVDKEKQEKFAVQCELQGVREQLSDQSEYCASMGAACCTLLWRVSRCEESIQSILVGSKVEDFLMLVCSTLESYVQTYRDDIPQEQTHETQFILALCGTITNIAASPFGRDYLMKKEQGSHLVDVLITALSETPSSKCSKMKNLILMSLYNISINQRGMKLISGKPGILSLLLQLAQEESCGIESRVHSVRLMQSLLCEQKCSPALFNQAQEILNGGSLTRLASDRCQDIRQAAVEILAALRMSSSEP